MTARLLSFEAIAEVLSRLAPAKPVLVGGQALNYWTTVFDGADDLESFGPFASKDIDFQGDRGQVTRSATLLGGVARFPDLDDMAPVNSGIVTWTDASGSELTIDFLPAVYGLNTEDVEQLAIPVDFRGAQIRVMHPVHCLESRVHNVAGIPGKYANRHGLHQLHAAIICAREYIGRRARDDRRPALRATKRVFRFAVHHRHAQDVYRDHCIEVFDAVHPWTALGELFRDRGYPQMKAVVDRRRASVARGVGPSVLTV